MEKNNQNLQEKLRALRLTPDEKAALRARILPHVLAPRRSPYYASFIYSVRRPVAIMAAVLLLLVATTGGTAFAAQGALPGDLLYGVKVHVTEPIQVALATTPEAKVQVEASLAQERLEEAQTLAARGSLDATTTAELAANLGEHAAAAAAAAQELSASDPSVAAQITTELSASLAANGAVLSDIASGSGSTQVRSDSQTLAQAGEHGALAIARSWHGEGEGEGSTTLAYTSGSGEAPHPALQARPMALRIFGAAATNSPASSTPALETTSSTSASSSPAQATSSEDMRAEATAAALEARAQQALNDAQKALADIHGSLSTSTRAQAQAELAQGAQLMSEGSTALGAGDYAQASQSFAAALRQAITLETYLNAGEALGPKLLPALLKLSL